MMQSCPLPASSRAAEVSGPRVVQHAAADAPVRIVGAEGAKISSMGEAEPKQNVEGYLGSSDKQAAWGV
jgi:hypothetical protein